MVNVKELSIGNMLIFLGIYLITIFSLIYVKLSNASYKAPQFITEAASAIGTLGISDGNLQLVILALIVLSAAIMIAGSFRSFGAY